MWTDEPEPMDTSDFSWCWYYLADCGRWHRFEDDPDNLLRSEDMETSYKENSNSVLFRCSGSSRSRLDFSEMLLTDLTTGRARRIKRSCNIEKSCSCFCAPPVFWENVDPAAPYQLIPLSELTPEFETVANYVKHDRLLNRSIVTIKRVQNLDLWEMYCRKKKQLMRIKGVKDIPERRLFHGTDAKNVDSICKYNFDLRLAGQHGRVYGKGIYFATYASLADKYSSDTAPPLTNVSFFGAHGPIRITKRIFLARVIVGNPTVGKKEMKKPDDGSLENVHDCCVDYIEHPKIFVIFDANQIYPEYLIEYE